MFVARKSDFLTLREATLRGRGEVWGMCNGKDEGISNLLLSEYLWDSVEETKEANSKVELGSDSWIVISVYVRGMKRT